MDRRGTKFGAMWDDVPQSETKEGFLNATKEL